MKLDERCQAIRLVLSDVDGVLTDGGIWYDNQGIELKRFHVRDGLGIKLWQRSGFNFGVVTARNSQVVKLRCSELGINYVRQGVRDKLATVEELADSLSLQPEQVCFIGDDLPDLAPVRWSGLGVTVSDGAAELKQAADHVTTAAGGMGAVRELLEWILRSTGRWDDLAATYGHS